MTNMNENNAFFYMNKFPNVKNELDKSFMYIFTRHYSLKSYFEC